MLYNTILTFNRGKKICICPLLPKDDWGKNKSSVCLLYLVKARFTVIKEKSSSEFSIISADSPGDENLISRIKEKGYTLCLIDNFVGSGDTAESIAKFFEEKGVSKDMMVIVSLVGMRFAYDKLSEKGIRLISMLLVKRVSLALKLQQRLN